MTFNVETEQSNKVSLLDVNIICQQGKFITSVYRKCSVVYTPILIAFYLILTKLA